MVYTSKRRKFRDFVKTKNWRYYLLFLIIFVTLIVSVIIISGKNKTEDNNPTVNTTFNSNETPSTNTNEDNSLVRGKFKLCINTAIQQLTIYAWNDSSNNYEKSPLKIFPVSSDSDIKEGQYSFGPNEIIKDIWFTSSEGKNYRYITQFGSEIEFHSAEFSKYNDKNSLIVDSYNLIGKTSSKNGFILLCSDAKWIYENCSYASEIYIYSDDKEIISKDISPIIPIAQGLFWDPSDTGKASPYCLTGISSLKCKTSEITIEPTSDLSILFNYVYAKDENNTNISDKIYTTFKGDLTTEGIYSVNFYIADIFGKVLQENLIVKVVIPEPPTEENTEDTTEDTTEDNAEDSTEDSTEDNTEDNPANITEDFSEDNNMDEN